MDAFFNSLLANADKIGTGGAIVALVVLGLIVKGVLVPGRSLARAEKQVDEDRVDRRAETEVMRRLVRWLERRFPETSSADLYDDLSGRGSA